jgi:hypothetical protein
MSIWNIMKLMSIFLICLLANTCLHAQVWSGPTNGNIYYNSGKVGIGTNSPEATLDVNKVLSATTTPDNTTSQVVISSSFVSGQNNRSTLYFFPFNLTRNSSPAAISAIAAPNTASSLAFYTNPNLNYSTIPLERMRISSEGNIGIGTAFPGGKLHIAGTNAISTEVRVAGNNSAGNWFSYFGSDGNNPDFSTKLRVLEENIAGLSNGFTITAEQSFGTPRYAIGTKDNTPIAIFSNGAERVRFTNNGNVGIGTTSPIAKLHIAGDNRINSVYITGTEPGIYYTNGTKKWNTFYTPIHNGFGIYEETGGLEGYRLFIKEGGNIGVGTMDPGQYKLAVEGNLGARKVIVTKASWADYVFEPTYKLPSLKEVEVFIKQHKHLPDVPTAKEVEKNGLDVGENQAILLKKIEELTLYIIELKKENERMNERINKLESENNASIK